MTELTAKLREAKRLTSGWDGRDPRHADCRSNFGGEFENEEFGQHRHSQATAVVELDYWELSRLLESLDD